MRHWSGRTIVAAASTALLIAFQFGVTPAASQGEVYKPRRTANGTVDLNGIWQSLNTANWDIQAHGACAGQVVALGAIGAVPAGIGVVEGDQIPYLPAAAAKKRENFENR